MTTEDHATQLAASVEAAQKDKKRRSQKAAAERIVRETISLPGVDARGLTRVEKQT